jgi:hypothetical protein
MIAGSLPEPSYAVNVVPATADASHLIFVNHSNQRERNGALLREHAVEIDSGIHRLTSQAFSTTAARSAERPSVYVRPSRPSRCSACKRCRRQRRGSRNSQEARLCPRPRYRVPSFCSVPGESRRRQLPTGTSRHIFASTRIITGALSGWHSAHNHAPSTGQTPPIGCVSKGPATPATD